MSASRSGIRRDPRGSAAANTGPAISAVVTGSADELLQRIRRVFSPWCTNIGAVFRQQAPPGSLKRAASQNGVAPTSSGRSEVVR